MSALAFVLAQMLRVEPVKDFDWSGIVGMADERALASIPFEIDDGPQYSWHIFLGCDPGWVLIELWDRSKKCIHGIRDPR